MTVAFCGDIAWTSLVKGFAAARDGLSFLAQTIPSEISTEDNPTTVITADVARRVSVWCGAFTITTRCIDKAEKLQCRGVEAYWRNRVGPPAVCYNVRSGMEDTMRDTYCMP